MTSAISKFVFKRVLEEGKKNNQGRDDPYFETVPTRRMGISGMKEGTKKRKRALPPGLSTEDEKTLVKVKRRAYRLDMALGTCCGIKIGWGSVIGIIPGFGDVIDSLLALMVVRTAQEANLPGYLITHMFMNIALDFAIGLVPFVGDLADMWYKCNTRNALLLEDFLRKRGKENIKKGGLPNQPDLSLGDGEYMEEGIITSPPVTEPQPTMSRGLFGSRKQKEPDLEAQRPARVEAKPAKSKSTKNTMRGGTEGSSRAGVGAQESGITKK